MVDEKKNLGQRGFFDPARAVEAPGRGDESKAGRMHAIADGATPFVVSNPFVVHAFSVPHGAFFEQP